MAKKNPWGTPGLIWTPTPAKPRVAGRVTADKAAAAAKPKTTTHVTKRGENLSVIAKAHNTTLAKVLKLNPTLAKRKDNVIFRGTKVRTK